ncbi:MAG: tetratricopeptide repeat protein [Pyrinomonadaceae bacterium]
MLGHLSENQLEDYGRQRLSAAELLSVSDHLGLCESCRAQVVRTMEGDAAFFALRSEVFGPPSETIASHELAHLTVAQVAEYVDGMPPGEELQLAADHLTSCEQCALAVNDLRAFKTQVAATINREYHPASVGTTSESWRDRLFAFLPSPLVRSPLALSSALAVLLLMVMGWLIWQAQQKTDPKPEVVTVTPSPSLSPPLVATPSPVPAPDQAVAPVVAELNDGGGRLALDRDGKLSGVDTLPPAYQRMVKDSLTNQRLARSSLLAGLNRPGSSLMGTDEQGNKFSVIEPIGKVILSDRPTFRWSKLEGATGYVVEGYDEKFNVVVTSPQLTGNSWTVSQPLKRGETYSWQVKAIKGEQEIKSPRPPAPQAKFRILDQRKANELAQAQKAYASSHLTLGLLYADAGLLDQAEKEFRALQKANPDSALVRRLLSQVQKLRR